MSSDNPSASAPAATAGQATYAPTGAVVDLQVDAPNAGHELRASARRLHAFVRLRSELPRGPVENRSLHCFFCHGSNLTIEMQPVPWLWPGYLPQGATSLLVGDPGNGKTLSGLDLLARITVGSAWPDGTANTFGPRNVIVLSAEDANEYTIRPRIEAAGGDSSRVFVIPADKAVKLCLDTDVERLRLAIEKYQPLALLVDPLSAYMPGIDSYRDNEVRSSLARFVAILIEYNVADTCEATIQ